MAVTALSGGVNTREAIKGLSFSLAPEMRARDAEGKFGPAADCWSYGVAAYLMGCKDMKLLSDTYASPWQVCTLTHTHTHMRALCVFVDV